MFCHFHTSDVFHWLHLVAETLVLPVQLLSVELLLLQEDVLLLQSLYGGLQLPVLLLQLQNSTGNALVELVDQRFASCGREKLLLEKEVSVTVGGRGGRTLGVGVVVVLCQLLQLPAQVS